MRMEEQQRAQLYAAFRSRDSRFDGRFFVGVRSTGIYCRPVCRARLPKPENCVFFASAAEAEKAGFRPCLLCRPELAPGFSAADARVSLAARAARYLGENCVAEADLETLAARLGCSGRHLRRVFAQQYHVSPVEYLQSCRLLLAKGLLTDTALSVTQVAMAAGFGSIRRFNALFLKRYRLSPTGFRRQAKREEASSGICVALGYHPPYAWQRILRFLAARAIPGVEEVADGEYRRVLRMEGKGGALFGWMRVRDCPEKDRLSVTVSESLLPVLPQLLGLVRELFDLGCDPAAVEGTLAAMNDTLPGAFVPGIRVPGCVDPFELCVRAVLGQQITVRAASALAGRLAAAFGTPVEGAPGGLRFAFPSPADVLAGGAPIEERLGPLGVIAARARAVGALAERFAAGQFDWQLLADPEAEMEKLLQIKGIGPWTAQYIAMRAMRWTDAMPASDLGIRRALGGRTPREIEKLSQAWRPWRSYATMALWEMPVPEKGGVGGG